MYWVYSMFCGPDGCSGPAMVKSRLPAPALRTAVGEMQETRRGVLGGHRVELDELVVVDLDERLVGDVVFAEVEGLFKAELLVEGDGGGEIVDADGDVGDAVKRRGVGFGLGVGKRGDKDKGE